MTTSTILQDVWFRAEIWTISGLPDHNFNLLGPGWRSERANTQVTISDAFFLLHGLGGEYLHGKAEI